MKLPRTRLAAGARHPYAGTAMCGAPVVRRAPHEAREPRVEQGQAHGGLRPVPGEQRGAIADLRARVADVASGMRFRLVVGIGVWRGIRSGLGVCSSVRCRSADGPPIERSGAPGDNDQQKRARSHDVSVRLATVGCNK